MDRKEAGKELAERYGLKQETPNFLYSEGNKAKLDIDGFVDFMIDRHHYKTIFGKRSEEIWVYSKLQKTYKPNGREHISTNAEMYLKNWLKTNNLREIVEKIKRKTAISREDFDNIPLNLIPLKNGIFDLDKNELLEHNPKYNFTYKHDIEYNPNADCPKFKEFLQQTLSPDDLDAIQEEFGFGFYRRYFVKKAFIFHGEHDTGKTLLLNIKNRVIGEKNISGLSLHDITTGKKTDVSFLYKKLVNIYDDLSDGDLKDVGGLKIATGGGNMTGEVKFGDIFVFQNYSKLVFACNKIPTPKNITDMAYFNRWLIFEFLNQIPEEEQDKFLYDKLTTKEELEGILLWSLNGLMRLIKNGRFSYNRTTDEVKAIMEYSSHPLLAFATDCLDNEPNCKITKEQMFRAYNLWAKERNRKSLTIGIIGRNLQRFCPYISAGRYKGRYWSGVSFKPEIKETLEKLGIYDTLDTSKNNMSSISSKIQDIIKKETSNPSEPKVKTTIINGKEMISVE